MLGTFKASRKMNLENMLFLLGEFHLTKEAIISIK